MRRWQKITAIVAAILCVLVLALAWPAYIIARNSFDRYFDRWGEKLVDFERRGLLSTEFGAAWQDILADKSMEQHADRIVADSSDKRDTLMIVDGIRLDDYPSLSLITRLNEMNEYSNTIEITDRKNRRIALIRTNHTRGRLDEFPKTLITALVAAEDERFWVNPLGFEFRSYVRAVLTAVQRTITRLRVHKPMGTSTITQQVAKLFLSQLDEEGRRHVERDIDRKLREMRIAAALRKMYQPESILEVYLNHCVTSDHGLIGCKDIAIGLFGKKPSELTDAQCIYLARMVKWGRNLKGKIIRQCHIDMPRMGEALGWDETRRNQVLAQIDSLTFEQPRRVVTSHGQLVDCANEYWQRVLERTGTPTADLAKFDIISPTSLVRKKGNLTLQLTVDLPLQKALESLVNARGYGPDTVIITEARIGSSAEEITRATPPTDTLRKVERLSAPRTFSEPDAEYTVAMAAGDTLYTNIRYRQSGKNAWRRSQFFYANRPVPVSGQYYAYAAIDSRTGKLLAYYSRDKIGSKLAGLIRYRTPNGSSTAKPIFNALCFDQGVFAPYQMWNDSFAVTENVAWKRSMVYQRGKLAGVVFARSAVKGRGYEVHNHDDVIEGCQYVFDALATSNNILGAETCYRLDRDLFDRAGDILPGAFPLVQYFYRLGALQRLKDRRMNAVTGVRAYKELARIAGAPVDTVWVGETPSVLSDSMYSVSLGTLELSLLEQAHLFNVLYNNDLIERPADRPSLFIESITLNNRPVSVPDTIKRFHPFADINTIKPSWLGMHKRLISNPWDKLADYDMPWTSESALDSARAFDPFAFTVNEPMAQFAKSGTTDDIIRPFYAPSSSAERTNFGMWNAVLRLDLAKLAGGSEPEIADITIACIGECVTRYTGPRDGKTLHGFLTRELLRKAGVKAPNGFYTQYERYLVSATPDSARMCGRYVAPTGIEQIADTLDTRP